MKLYEIYKIIDNVAPKSLSDEYCRAFGAYDNSGVLVDTGDEITGVLFSLDLSFAAIEKAKKAGANLIVSHHPAIYGKIGDIRQSDFEPLDKKLIEAIKNGISVVSMHLNLDVAAGGIDESLMQGVCISAIKEKDLDCATSIGLIGTPECALMHAFNGVGYGRAYNVNEISLGGLTQGISEIFKTDKIAVYGDKNKQIKRVASFCGAGGDEEAVRFAKEQGADVILSADFKHHVLALAVERGLCVIALTHYASEEYGFNQFYKKISRSIALPCVYHTDEVML